MPLALFDLDNTLLVGDSDYLWGQFLVDNKKVDGKHYEEQNQKFYQDYQLGTLDIQAYLSFQLSFLAKHDQKTLNLWREQFVTERIKPIIPRASRDLLQWHREQGNTLVIVTATNRFVTGPIAKILGVSHLLATDLEESRGRYTGRPLGIPCFREGKVLRLRKWIKENNISLEGSWFYSDSHNDLPLMALVDHPVAVDPDETLHRIAQEKGWNILSLRTSLSD